MKIRENILVVDDKPDNLRLLSNILSGAGYKVRKVLNGRLAIDAAQLDPPDLILLDIMMPFRTGWEVLRELRASELTKNLPVAMLTARAVPQDYQGSDLPFFSDYITKPFEPEDLIRRVKRLLHQ